ncbi:MAG: hypothetical protein HYS09_09525 [Chloroflexi bacterium]|nr:hypothetical protein [Chloroflexota bacterium]
MQFTKIGISRYVSSRRFRLPVTAPRPIRLVRRAPSEMTLARLLTAYRLARLREHAG